MPFAIEIPLPLETSDLNPSGICAADCRLIRMVALPPPRGRARRARQPSSSSSPVFSLAHFAPVISLLVFPSFRARSRRSAGRCRNSPGPFLAANVTLLRSAKQTAVGR